MNEERQRHLFNLIRGLVILYAVVPIATAIGVGLVMAVLVFIGRPVPSELGLAATAAISFLLGTKIDTLVDKLIDLSKSS